MIKDPRVYLVQMLERAERIARYIEDGEAAFNRDEKTQDAVIRNFEIIGEAAKRVPDGFRTLHPEIPWRVMAGFRDVLIHGYEGVDLARVWLAAARDLPTACAAIARILPPLDQLERELSGEDEISDSEGHTR